MRDAVGKKIEVCDVCLHFYVSGHAIQRQFVRILGFTEAGNIRAERPSYNIHWRMNCGYEDVTRTRSTEKTTVYRSENLVVTNRTWEAVCDDYWTEHGCS